MSPTQRKSHSSRLVFKRHGDMHSLAMEVETKGECASRNNSFLRLHEELNCEVVNGGFFRLLSACAYIRVSVSTCVCVCVCACVCVCVCLSVLGSSLSLTSNISPVSLNFHWILHLVFLTCPAVASAVPWAVEEHEFEPSHIPA